MEIKKEWEKLRRGRERRYRLAPLSVIFFYKFNKSDLRRKGRRETGLERMDKRGEIF